MTLSRFCTLRGGPHPEVAATGWALVVVLVALAIGGCGRAGAPHPQAVGGVLDLRNAPLEDPIPLTGYWKMLPGEDSPHFADFELDDTNWEDAYLPARFSEQGLPTEGMAWYRLRLRVPSGTTFKGFLPYAGHAYTLYTTGPDGKQTVIAEGGHPALTADAVVNSRKLAVFTLPSDTTLTLAWKIANFGYQHGGPFYAIKIGPSDVIESRLLWGTSFDVATFFLYLVIAFFFLVNWLWRRTDRPSLAVGLLAFVMAVRTAVLTGRLEALLPGVFDFEVRIMVEAVSFFALFGLLGFLVVSFFPLEFAPLKLGPFRLLDSKVPEAAPPHGALRPLLPEPLRRLNTAFAVAVMGSGAASSMAALVATPWVTSHLLAGLRWFALVSAPFGVASVLMAAERRRPMSTGMIIGFGLLVIVGIHDVLFSMNLLPGPHYLMGYAFTGFLLIQCMSIARRNADNAEALHKAHRQALAASEGKSRFISAVSHEMRTPLTSILGFAQILQQEGAQSLAKHHLEFLDAIRSSADRMLALVNDLLDLTRAESGKLQMNMTKVSVDDLLRDTRRQLRNIALEKGLDFIVEPPDTPLWIHADDLRIHQVLTNLTTNAIKFTERGSVSLTAALSQHDGKEVCALTVADTGIGIAPEFLPRLFEPFAQENRGYGLSQSGSGLGLALSRDLVRRMGGDLVIESEVNSGSRFTILIPTTDPPESAGRTSSAKRARTAPSFPKAETA